MPSSPNASGSAAWTENITMYALQTAIAAGVNHFLASFLPPFLTSINTAQASKGHAPSYTCSQALSLTGTNKASHLR